MAQRILVVDDEQTLCEVLKFNLEVEGYRADVANSGEEALTLNLEQYDLILLDVMMESVDGFTLAKILKSKAETKDIPIIFLTAKDSDDDMVNGLNLGADDYISKPYSIKNVLARVRTVLRRTTTKIDNIISFEGISINTDKVEVRVDGVEVKMPRKEYELLVLFLSKRGRIFSRAELLHQIWEDNVVVIDRTIDVNITRLRSKLGSYGKHIVTRSGYGYGFIE